MALASWTQQQILSQLNSGYHWSSGTITYSFPTTSSGIYGVQEARGFRALNATQQSYAKMALQEWDDLIAPDLSQTTSTSNIDFGMTNTGIGYAQTYYPTIGSVWFSSAYSDLVSPQVGQHSFLTYIHEIGHAFGLNHMGNYNGTGNWTPSSYQDSGVYSVMSYFGPNWGSGSSNGEGLVAWADWIGADGRLYSPQTPMVNDIMAIQSMYGIETSTRTGDTVYGFGSNITGTLASIYNFTVNQNPIITIFDSSGNDTLNLSGWTTPSTINLAPGGYSSCNSMTNNIAIAYSCNIENAIGGAGADTINGNALDNRLDGGAGADKLAGGAGNDTYIVDNAADVITELSGAGIDLVQSSVSYILAANVENLTLTGSANINGTGNTLANIITGNSGNNILDGQAGTDTMDGGSGSDIYLINLAGDHPAAEIRDSGSTGTDEVRFTATSAGTLTLYAGDTGIERVVIGTGTGVTAATGATTALNVNASSVLNALTIVGNSGTNILTGTALNDVLDGGAGNDTLIGGNGDDTLIGGAGNDILTGGAGADKFVFNASLNASNNVDTLTDFQPGLDIIQLSSAIFKTIGTTTGSLTQSQFWAGAGVIKGHDTDDRIVYNTTTGALYYDADGSGSGAATQICLLGSNTHPTIASTNFQVIA